MKIGSGGLQSMLMQDNLTIKQLDPARRLGVEQLKQHMNMLEKKPVNIAMLFKAVERLNQAAQMFNYPLIFEVVNKKNKRIKVLVKNKETGDVNELTPHQAIAFAKKRENVAGKKLDVYS